MSDETSPSSRTRVVHRIFFVQLALIGAMTLLAVVAYLLEGPTVVEGDPQATDSASRMTLGFFWFSFIAGAIGASVGLLQRIRKDKTLLEEVAHSSVSTFMPLLYGAVMAAVAYGLFISEIVSGELFPKFWPDNETVRPASMRALFATRPASVPDAVKLLVWSFIAGYSERFVTNLIGRLEKQADKDETISGRKSSRRSSTK